jgi:hypothetical protein
MDYVDRSNLRRTDVSTNTVIKAACVVSAVANIVAVLPFRGQMCGWLNIGGRNLNSRVAPRGFGTAPI